jgi:ribosomal RNA assembly protein
MKGTERLRIPKTRIAVLIGPEGKVKQRLEKATNTTITVDSEDGLVVIETKEDTEDPLATWKARDVVQAIGRGFSPHRAFWLLDEDVYIRVIDLEEYLTTPNQIRRIKGRVIGEGGKTRRNIEELTDTFVSVMGDTVSIIGELENQEVAISAVTRLLRGAEHSSVYRYLNEQRRTLKRRRATELWKPIGPETTD